ncbi:MAG: VTT domain-containing protein [Thermoproteota archaeon]|jgi:membrane protein YqaA with SNARE-associated domain|nr:VTT domain-containing protein [Thermoproteota archaeon]
MGLLEEDVLTGIQALINNIVHNASFIKYGLIGLFLNGMLSSVVPIPTELTTSALLLAGESRESIFIVLAISSILGGFLAYYIGAGGNKLFHKLYKNPTEKDTNQGGKILAKYGWIAIFFCSWIPVLGDVIPIVAGAKRYDFKKFSISMSAGKTVKVFAIVYIIGIIITSRMSG